MAQPHLIALAINHQRDEDQIAIRPLRRSQEFNVRHIDAADAEPESRKYPARLLSGHQIWEESKSLHCRQQPTQCCPSDPDDSGLSRGSPEFTEMTIEIVD
jgi:hypothetical protein